MFEDFRYRSNDGLDLHARIYDGATGAATPVICLPGLTRNARDFDGLARHLADAGRKVVAFDYRGRGESQWAPDWTSYSAPVETADVLAGLEALGIGRAAFVGTSRGGLILHVLAAMRPELLAAAVLNDIGPVIEPEGLALIVAYLGRSEGGKLADFAAAAAIQRRIHAEAFPALTDDDWLRMAQALYRQTADGVVPDFDPALLNTLSAFDPARPMPALWQQFDAMRSVPMMVIRGEHSRLLSVATVQEMAARHPGLEAATAAGQGHAPLLETAGLAQRIGRFIDAAVG